MKILSYNIRGMGKGVKRKEIRELVRRLGVDVCCVQETKMENLEVSICKDAWGDRKLDWACRGSVGRSGGILTMWDDDIFCKISSWHLHGALIVNGFWRRDGTRVCIINVYASCAAHERIDLWDSLRMVVEQNVGICICVIGDFNIVRRVDERVGISSRSESREMEIFDSFIDRSNLIELSISGKAFTWYRPDGTCKSKLDRILVNDEWLEKWPESVAKGMDRSLSDHCPIILDMSSKNWGPRPFHFFNAWLSHPGFDSFVEERWRSYAVSGRAGFVLKEKLKLLKSDLKLWNREVFGYLDTNIDMKKERIGVLDRLDDTFGLEEEEIIERKRVSAELLRDLIWKERILQQKTKARWIKEGDMNSRYFHCWISKRRKGNEIEGLWVGDSWIEEVEQVRNEVFSHFKAQFCTVTANRPSFPANFGQSKLEEADNVLLTAPFMEDEIRKAIWDCEPSRSPGPDGFSFGFIRKHWNLLRSDFQNLLNEFHSNAKFVKGLNPLFVTLIPKKEGAQRLSEFRPISLIGCVYKVIAKILAKWLSKVVDSVVSENQSAFIGGRQIMDGIVILNEAIHEAKRRKKKCFIFKIDFEKAYDSVNWDFLDEMMTLLNFDPT